MFTNGEWCVAPWNKAYRRPANRYELENDFVTDYSLQSVHHHRGQGIAIFSGPDTKADCDRCAELHNLDLARRQEHPKGAE